MSPAGPRPPSSPGPAGGGSRLPQDRSDFAPHFPFAELTVTQQVDPNGVRLVNAPGCVEYQHLIRTSWLLEDIRTVLGVPMNVTSGFRCEAVERKVQGRPTGLLAPSQHRLGQAADFLPRGLDIATAYEAIWLSDLPYDQLLFERGGGAPWIHVSCAPPGRPPRRQALASKDNGRTWILYRPGLARSISEGM